MRRNPMKEKTIVIEIDEQGNCSIDLEGAERVARMWRRIFKAAMP